MNAAQWGTAFRQALLTGQQPSIGFILLVFDKASPGESAVCVGNIKKDKLRQALADVQRKFGDVRRVLMPGEDA